MYLLLLFYGGLVGYAPPNFVFTYMGVVCQEQGCDSAFLSGLTMISYCVAETTSYMLIKALKNRVNHALRLNVTLASLAVHYCFFGFFLPHLSPYFFLVESLSFSTSAAASLYGGKMITYLFTCIDSD